MTVDTMADTPWYAIQSYSGHENKVQKLIQRRIEEEPGEVEERQIREVIVPTQEVLEIRNGKRVTVTKRLLSGLRAGPDAVERADPARHQQHSGRH